MIISKLLKSLLACSIKVNKSLINKAQFPLFTILIAAAIVSVPQKAYSWSCDSNCEWYQPDCYAYREYCYYLANLCSNAIKVADSQVQSSNGPNLTTLTQYQKSVLRPFFGNLVDQTFLRYNAILAGEYSIDGKPFHRGYAGQTFGNRIYIITPLDEQDKEQLVTIAHEMKHVQQFSQVGDWPRDYCKKWIDADFSYENNQWEIEARAFENQFRSTLASEPQSPSSDSSIASVHFPSPDRIPLTNLQTYADRRGAIAAFVNGHWNGNTGRYNVILITGGAQRIHDARFDELGISLGTPPDRIPLTNLQTYADRRGAIAAFVNGHWNGNTGRYNVILITGGAQRIHDARFDELGISLGTPPDRIPLTNLQTYADRRGAIATFVNGHWNGNTGRYNVILITGGVQRIHDVSFEELGVSAIR